MGWTPRALWRTSAADKSIWKFLLPFYPVFSWVILCHLGRKPPCPEDYSKPVAILTGIHLLAFSQDGATTLPGRMIFYFFFQSSSSAAALMSSRSRLTAKRREEERMEGRSDAARVSWKMRADGRILDC
ncbi:hypothetical protein Q9966_014711 [Columba livia]|nr:hypothetical protein Q9966_014711 [Columba livia]